MQLYETVRMTLNGLINLDLINGQLIFLSTFTWGHTWHWLEPLLGQSRYIRHKQRTQLRFLSIWYYWIKIADSTWYWQKITASLWYFLKITESIRYWRKYYFIQKVIGNFFFFIADYIFCTLLNTTPQRKNWSQFE